MKYLQIFFLVLSGVSLNGVEPNVAVDEDHNVSAGERELLKESGLLWEKIGPHARKGSKLAKDNREMFDLYYRSLAKEVVREAEAEAAVGGESSQEIFSLMCLPTAYGWPMYRTLNKTIKYTGLVAIRSAGEYEVAVEVSPANSQAKIVLEIDGEAIEEPISAGKGVTIRLTAGVRALSIRTNDDVQLQFGKLHVDRVVEN